MKQAADRRADVRSRRTAELSGLGVLRMGGPDAESFAQGQLSNDIARLAPGGALLAGCHNPQGRVIALLRVIRTAPETLLAVLPRELIEPLTARLRRYVLRAKVRLEDASPQYRVQGLIAPGAGAAPADAAGTLTIDLGGEPRRQLQLVSRSAGAPDAGDEAAAALEWQRLQIAAGLPQVYARTSESFLAQMLNLDLLDAIAFDKGCYTGQEVIARAHYRGRVKRRMQRLRTRAPQALAPGDTARLPDGRTLKVVDAVALEDGRCEFLAVTALGAAASGEPAASPAEEEDAAAGALLDAEFLSLPYALPG